MLGDIESVFDSISLGIGRLVLLLFIITAILWLITTVVERYDKWKYPKKVYRDGPYRHGEDI